MKVHLLKAVCCLHNIMKIVLTFGQIPEAHCKLFTVYCRITTFKVIFLFHIILITSILCTLYDIDWPALRDCSHRVTSRLAIPIASPITENTQGFCLSVWHFVGTILSLTDRCDFITEARSHSAALPCSLLSWSPPQSFVAEESSVCQYLNILTPILQQNFRVWQVWMGFLTFVIGSYKSTFPVLLPGLPNNSPFLQELRVPDSLSTQAEGSLSYPNQDN